MSVPWRGDLESYFPDPGKIAHSSLEVILVALFSVGDGEILHDETSNEDCEVQG